VVGGDAIHASARQTRPAKDVAAAEHHGDLHIHLHDLLDLEGNAFQHSRIDAVITAAEQSLGSLSDARTASRRAVTLATARYNRGIIDYLNVVDAQRQEYAIEEQVVMTQASVDDQYIELYRNLGGGWQGFHKIPPTPRPLPAVLAIFKDTLARGNPSMSR